VAIETNLIYCGDNLEVLSKFDEKSVDLIYADPPFFSNKHYEIIWGNGAEMKVYEDRWRGGINVYVEWMKLRLAQCWRVLKDTGTMYLHCDYHANHRLRVAMDEVFGENNFRNEIIWCYTGPSAVTKDFPRKHDTILRYAKSGDFTFNDKAIRIPYSESFLSRRQAEEGSGGIFAGKVGRDPGEMRSYKKGKIPEDWWADIPSGGQISRNERLGYPTQKPELLLKRIIEASSNKGEIVLDPFAGGGTTPVEAQKLERQWIAVDVSPIACNKMKIRLGKIGVSNIHVIGAPKTIDELKALEPFQFQNWVIDRIGGTPSRKKSSDMGIDGYSFMAREPVQVKQSEGIGRNVVDNFETALRREHKAVGFIVAFSFGKGAYEEVARAKLAKDSLDIRLVRVDEMDKHFGHT
jgi:DNA modification methylase